MLDEWWRYFDSVAKEGGREVAMTKWDAWGGLQGQRRIKDKTVLIIEIFLYMFFSIHSK